MFTNKKSEIENLKAELANCKKVAEELRAQIRESSRNRQQIISKNILDSTGIYLSSLYEALEYELKGKSSETNLITAVKGMFKALEKSYKLRPLGTLEKPTKYDPAYHKPVNSADKLSVGDSVQVIQIGWEIAGNIVQKCLVKPHKDKDSK